MKLLIHAHAYPDFLERLYGHESELASLDYEAQFAALDRESHISGNAAWAEALRPLGYDVMVTISNSEHLQKAWAKEHGLRYEPASWRTEIAEAQLASFQPDLVCFTCYLDLRPGWIRFLRERHSGVRMFAVWCGMPFGSNEIFKEFDLVLTCIPELDERFRSLGCNSRHLHHAFDDRVLGRIETDHERDIPFSFIGQLIHSRDFHQTRIRQLERIADALEITIFSSAHELYRAQQRRRPVRVLRNLVDSVPYLRDRVALSERLRPHIRPAVFGLAMYQTLQRSQVTYNSHIDISAGSASNRRLFEATGVGSCLLTDHKGDIATLFEPDREVVTFSSVDDCIDKAKWLLDHPRERREIAQAGQRRTLADHTYTRRAGELDSIIRAALTNGGASNGNRT